MFNKAIMLGNLTRDIELRYSQNGSAIAKVGLATSRKFTSNGERKEEVCFIDLTFFGKTAEIANQYLRKGSKILVEGRISFEQWVDEQSGQKRSKHGFIVESMQMLDGRGSGEEQSNEVPVHHTDSQGNQTGSTTYRHTDYQPRQQAPQYQQPARMPENTLPHIDINEDEIPF